MEGFLASVQVMPWGAQEAEVYGSIRAKLEKKGVALGSMDMMIAAHAIAIKATLITNDKAFNQVREIPAVVNWATDLLN